MNSYKLTAFSKNGEKLLDESFEAENDEKAKELGKHLLVEKNLNNTTFRCTSAKGKLILFHS